MGRLRFHSDFGHIKGALRVSERFLAAMNHAALIYRSNAVCTWIPKNGCSNLRYSIALDNGMIDETHDISWIHHNNGLFAPELRDCFAASYTFVFVRCPVERLVSAFLDKLFDSIDVQRYRDAFSKLHDGAAIEGFFSFSTFVNLVISQELNDIHWRPQSDFLLYETYDDYFDIRSFERARDALKRRIDFDLLDTRDLLHHDRSRHEERCIERAHDLPIAALLDLKSKGVVPDTRSFYSREIASSVRSYWAADFALYRAHFGVPDLWREVGIVD